jgi:hypothetical protein
VGVEPTRHAKRASPDLKSGRTTGIRSPSVYLHDASCQYAALVVGKSRLASTIQKLKYLYRQIATDP